MQTIARLIKTMLAKVKSNYSVSIVEGCDGLSIHVQNKHKDCVGRLFFDEKEPSYCTTNNQIAKDLVKQIKAIIDDCGKQ